MLMWQLTGLFRHATAFSTHTGHTGHPEKRAQYAQYVPSMMTYPCQSLPTSVRKWRSTADSSGLDWVTQPDATRRKVLQAGGSRSGDVGFEGGEMALEALEKPPFVETVSGDLVARSFDNSWPPASDVLNRVASLLNRICRAQGGDERRQ